MTALNLGTTTLSAEIARMKWSNPKLYARTFARIYDHDAKFHDWRLPLYYNMLSLVYARKNRYEQGRIPENFMLESQIAVKMQEHDNPLYFVHSDLLRACLASDPARDLSIEKLMLPHEGFSLILPKGVMTHGENEVSFISVGLDRAGQKNFRADMDDLPLNFEITSADTALVISTYFTWTSETWTFRLNDEYINDLEGIDMRDSFSDMRGNEIDRSFSAEDEKFSNMILVVVLNLMCAMRVKPEIVVHERRVKQLRRDRTKELWQPNVLGKAYRIAISGGVEAGTHASPRTHWRRGHFRQQGVGRRNTTCVCTHDKRMHADTYCQAPDCLCTLYARNGDAYSETITIWIEPILVMKKEKQNDTESVHA